MASFAVFIAGLVIAGVIAFIGGWTLRGLRDKARTEAARDAREDEDHGR